MKKDNPLKDKSYAFAVRIVKMYKYLCDKKHEYVLSKQVLRSGTSIGANIVEANGAISKDDFSAKIVYNSSQKFTHKCFQKCILIKYFQ